VPQYLRSLKKGEQQQKKKIPNNHFSEFIYSRNAQIVGSELGKANFT